MPLELGKPGVKGPELNELRGEESKQCKTGVDTPREQVPTAARMPCTYCAGTPHATMPSRTNSGGHRGGNVTDGEGAHADEIEGGARDRGKDGRWRKPTATLTSEREAPR